MRFLELQDNNKEVKKLRSEELSEGWEDIEEVFHYKYFLYVLKVICSKLISRHYENPLASHFGIKKMQKLIARKYY